MKQYYCFLERFNNYFNRKIIMFTSLDDYKNTSKDFFIPEDSHGNMLPFDFNPNDNVMTEIIANDLPFTPDYFLLLDEEENIVSRWFVLEEKRNRQGQWVYSLRRDVISDNLTNLRNAPIFVQRGMLPDDDPMVLNDEGMSLNQIKTSEQILQDKSKSSWIVCYLAKSLNASNITVDLVKESAITNYKTLTQLATALGISETVLVDLISFDATPKHIRLCSSTELYFSFTSFGQSYNGGMATASDFSSTSGGFTNSVGVGSMIGTPLYNNTAYPFDVVNNFASELQANSVSIVNQAKNVLNRTYYLQYGLALPVLTAYNGQYIKYSSKFYKLRLVANSNQLTGVRFVASNFSSWATVAQNVDPDHYSSSGTIDLYFREADYSIFLEEVSREESDIPTVQAVISSARKTCNNQEFDMIAVPASNINIDDNGTDILQTGDLAQRLASALAIKEGTNIYDVQLLPYCPIPNIISDDNELTITGLTENEDFDYIKQTNPDSTVDNIGCVFYVEQASFSSLIEFSLTLKDSMKVDSNCDLYRLVSPNYQGSFDFNVARNGGSVDFFTAYCTYKPYTPFIKVSPNLNYVYGSDYNDNRGLICGGDFSLPRASSAWEQYQLENKNYQNIFNREIQNLDFMQSIEKRNQIVSGAVGIFSDIAKGAGAGMYVSGNPVGALIGGAVGGISSAVGYGIDVDTLAKTQREVKQLAIDKYNYQLGNIKALPYTLTKVGAFDISSKIFPIIEYYTCTEKEKETFKSKIKYESMTVMRIGTLSEFMNFNGELNYFKGELIRNDEIADDPHTLNAIYEELLKGVYI